MRPNRRTSQPTSSPGSDARIDVGRHEARQLWQLVEDVVDTGLTLNFVCKTLALRSPASLAAVTLLDRPYRRLVENIPVRYVGFTVPDEFFVGYGFDLGDDRYRHLPDLRIAKAS